MGVGRGVCVCGYVTHVEIRGQLLGIGLCIFTLLATGSLQGCACQVSWLPSEVPLSPFPAPCQVGNHSHPGSKCFLEIRI